MGTDSESTPIYVTVDSDIEDLIPGFLGNRERDVVNLTEALERTDFPALKIIGHTMKGVGAGYGFDGVTEIGRDVETAAVLEDAAAVSAQIARLRDYLQRVEVRFQ